MKDDGVKLTLRHGLCLHSIACVLFLSGGFAALCDILQQFGHPGDWAYDDKTVALKVHGGAAMLFLIALGTLLPTHIRNAWNARRNRISGSFFIAVVTVLVATGYGIYYFSDERLRAVTQWVHLVLGIVEPMFLLTHVGFGWRTRKPAQVIV